LSALQDFLVCFSVIPSRDDWLAPVRANLVTGQRRRSPLAGAHPASADVGLAKPIEMVDQDTGEVTSLRLPSLDDVRALLKKGKIAEAKDFARGMGQEATDLVERWSA
jgi:hypothetical protein